MPELPEAETIRRDLEREITGRRIADVGVAGHRSVRRHAPELLADSARRQEVTGVGRHGKFLLVHLASGQALIVHLGMSGQLLFVEDASLTAPKHTHVAVRFDDGRELRFVDPRTFGEVFIGDESSLAHLGPDAFTGVSGPRHLQELLAARRRKLKDVLMDQRFVAGIGNIYSDEILWTARLRHDRISNGLKPAEARRLHEAIRAVLTDAIEHRGSSLADEQYRDVYGNVGRYAERHQVFAREGRPCNRCARPIERIRYGGRSHFSCRWCQR